MIGWRVEISYPGEVIPQVTKYVHFESANDTIDYIEELIKDVLEKFHSIMVYIKRCFDIDYAFAVNIWADKARIFEEDEEGTCVTAEEAKRFLHEAFLQMRKKAKEMHEAGKDLVVYMQPTNS